MSRLQFVVLMVLAAALAAAAAPGGESGDRAVVVGVNRYPGLPKEAGLAGCVNDALLMASVLTRRGFSVNVLTDQQATKKGIQAALLADARRSRKPGPPKGRYLLYFAGHATRDSERRISFLPYDAEPAGNTKDFTPEELRQALQLIPARSRSVILDTCFSAALSSKELDHSRPDRRTRFFSRDVGGGAKDLVRVNGQDRNAHLMGSEGICFFASGRENEQAAEEGIGGKIHGLFTYFLAQVLREKGNPSWGEVQSRVCGSVAPRVGDVQHPTVSPEYRTTPLFEPKLAGTIVPPGNLWDDFCTDVLDPERVQASMVPDRAVFRVGGGDDLFITVRAGTAGYLLILERGTSNLYRLHFPKRRQIDAARVVEGGSVTIPEDRTKSYKVDEAGTEHIRALLFTSREHAQAMMAAFPEGGTTLAQLRDALQKGPRVKRGPFWTSDLIFECEARRN